MLKSAYRKKVIITDDISWNAPEKESHAEVREAVLLLPKNYRIAIYLFYFEGYSTKEIAAAMKASRGRIKKAALILGMTDRVLCLRLMKYGLDYKSFRKEK